MKRPAEFSPAVFEHPRFEYNLYLNTMHNASNFLWLKYDLFQNTTMDADGGLFNEGDPSGVIERGKVWWPQAEAMVGFLNAYQLNGDPRFLDASLASWRFVQEYLVDREHGEWFQTVDEAGRPHDREKAGPWKTPYHNGRACMEVMGRIQKLTGSA